MSTDFTKIETTRACAEVASSISYEMRMSLTGSDAENASILVIAWPRGEISAARKWANSLKHNKNMNVIDVHDGIESDDPVYVHSSTNCPTVTVGSTGHPAEWVTGLVPWDADAFTVVASIRVRDTDLDSGTEVCLDGLAGAFGSRMSGSVGCSPLMLWTVDDQNEDALLHTSEPAPRWLINLVAGEL